MTVLILFYNMDRIFTLIIVSALLLAAGCKQEKHTPPPVEKIALTVRFFESMQNGNSAAAVRQGKNIFNLDRSQNHVSTLISIQESNETIVAAQKLLNSGKVIQALALINNALKNYPENNVLRRSKIKLEELKNAGKYLTAMTRARTAAAMNSARETASIGLSANRTAKLQKFFDDYEVLEQKMAKLEQQKTQDSLEAASAAAEKAKAEDARREAENLRFMQEIEKMSGEGEKMRQSARDIPFEQEQESIPGEQ